MKKYLGDNPVKKKNVIDNYLQQAVLSENKNSKVILAKDKNQNDLILKIVDHNSIFYDYFFEEYTLMKEISHPNLAEVGHFGIYKNQYYYTMPYYQTTDPNSYCIENGQRAFLYILTELLKGLSFLHNRGKIHGDISDDNIFVYLDNNKIKVKISDFGISSLIVAKKITDLSGSAIYVAPELISDYSQKKLSYSTDIYSLGIYLFSLITGEQPFKNKTPLMILKEKLNSVDINLLPKFEIDPEIFSIVKRMILPDPNLRYKNCEQIFEHLNPLIIKYKIDFTNSLADINVYPYRESTIKKILNNSHNIIVLKNLYPKQERLLAFLKSYITKTQTTNKEKIIFINKLSDLEKSYSNKYSKIIITTYEENIDYKSSNVAIIDLNNFTNEEFTRYINLLFGQDINNNILDFLNKNANQNFGIISYFIDNAIKNNAISCDKLKLKIQFDSLKQFVDNMPERYFPDIASLDKSTKEFLQKSAFLTYKFTIQDMKNIFNISIIKITDFLDILKKKEIIKQTSKNLLFRYDFVKEKIKQNTNDKAKKQIKNSIIKFYKEKKELTEEEIYLLFKYLLELKQFKVVLENYNIYLDKIENINRKLSFFKLVFSEFDNYLPINPYEAIKIFYNYTKFFYSFHTIKKLEPIHDKFNKIISKFSEKKFRELKIAENFEWYLYNYKHSELIKLYEDEKDFIEIIDEKLKPRIYYDVMKTYEWMGQFEKSLSVIPTSYLKKISNPSAKIPILMELGQVNSILFNNNKNLTYLKEAYKIAHKLKDINAESYLLLLFSLHFLDLSDTENGLIYIKKAESLLKKHKKLYHDYKITLYYAKYKYHFLKRDYFHLINTLAKEPFFKQLNGGFALFLLTENLFILGYKKAALSIINKIKKIFHSNKAIYLDIIRLEAKILIQYNNFEADRYEDYIAEYGKFSQKMTLINFHIVLFEYYLISKNLEKAKKKYNELLTLDKKYNFIPDLKVKFLILSGKYNLETENYKKAHQNIIKALTISKNIKNHISYSYKFNFYAYEVLKKLFLKNITTDDYKTPLKSAYSDIAEIISYLPNIKMKRTFKEQKIIKEILMAYKEEMLTASISSNIINFVKSMEKITKTLSKIEDTEKLFNEIIKIGMQISRTERGAVLIKDDINSELQIKYSINMNKESLEDIGDLSEDLINTAFSKKQPIFFADVLSSKKFDMYKSFVNLKIFSVIALPLILQNKILGVFYFDSRSLLAFSPEDIKFYKIFSGIAASAYQASRNYLLLKEKNTTLQTIIKNDIENKHIIGNSESLRNLLAKVEQIAQTDVTVLIEGESGTGKELVANEIYHKSKRRNKRFIKVDCGALSESIIESELFGHIKGAFTGSIKDKPGLFEIANGGTIFLDEISNLNLNMQAKLLRLIQQGEFKRVGENTIRKTDVRIIAASNIPLKSLVEKGKFREDLFFRLSIFPLEIPPLRNRKSDIPILAEYFLEIFNAKYNKDIQGFENECMNLLMEYNWPGNIRELQNEIEKAVIISNTSLLNSKYFKKLHSSKKKNIAKEPDMEEEKLNFKLLVDNYKYKLIKNALDKFNGNWSKTAEYLGIKRQSLKKIYDRIIEEKIYMK